MFKLNINTDNDAFSDAPEFETARILKDVARKLESGILKQPDFLGRCRDINGNVVGNWELNDE